MDLESGNRSIQKQTHMWAHSSETISKASGSMNGHPGALTRAISKIM